MNHGWSKGLFAWFLARTAWSRQFAQVFDFKRLQLDLLPGWSCLAQVLIQTRPKSVHIWGLVMVL
jgi:hypothetical protein